MMQHLIALTALFATKRDEVFARRDERGATAVEYGLLVVLIAAVIVGAVALLGDNILGGFDSVNNELGGTTSGS